VVVVHVLVLALVQVVPVRALAAVGRSEHMNGIRQFFARSEKTSAVTLPHAGVYHFLRETPSEKSRVHLRIDEDGSGLLIVNANRVYQLNPTAAFLSYLSLNKVPEKSAIESVRHSYNVSKLHALADLQTMTSKLDVLISGEECPICDLNLDVLPPFSSVPSAPYRMDLAVTYQCNNACAHCYNARPRNFKELSTEEWYTILDKLWEIGIPHIVFTGGEPTLREDLPLLIKHAENNGQITGLNTNGRKLSNAAYLKELIDAGLDHVQITFESHIPEIHDHMVCHSGAWAETLAGIRNVLQTSLYLMTNTTMLSHNQSTIPQTLEFLGSLGLKTVGLNALIYSGHGKTVGTGLSEKMLQPLLEKAQEITNSYNQKLIWYTPTQYCNFDPVVMELGVKGCTAALYNMCVEPNGDVIPCQSYYEPVGNLIKNDWKDVWEHELCVSLRNRKQIEQKCVECSLLAECGGGCPLSSQRS
jgi:radical SAM protein with 4Fe4S-binding SPASM domain